MNSLMSAIIFLFVTIFIARIVNERALKKLDTEMKARLIDLFSNFRIYSFGGLIALLGFYYVVVSNQLIDLTIAFVAYFVLILIFLLASAYYSRKILVDSNYPVDYIRSFMLSTVIKFAGISIFFFLYMVR